MFTFMRWLKELPHVSPFHRSSDELDRLCDKNVKLSDNYTTDHMATAMKGDS